MIEQREPWTMPEWMEPYQDLISNTGGNPIEELMNDTETTGLNNVVRLMLIIAVENQIGLLRRLQARGWLTPNLGAGDRSGLVNR